jgi:hypothetical protein
MPITLEMQDMITVNLSGSGSTTTQPEGGWVDIGGWQDFTVLIYWQQPGTSGTFYFDTAPVKGGALLHVRHPQQQLGRTALLGCYRSDCGCVVSIWAVSSVLRHGALPSVRPVADCERFEYPHLGVPYPSQRKPCSKVSGALSW